MKKQDRDLKEQPNMFAETGHEVIVDTQQGLTPEKQSKIRAAFRPFFDQCTQWKEKAQGLVITSIEQVDLMKQAKEARLALKRIRSSVENERKTLKEAPLAECKFIDETANSFKNEIEPIEDHLKKQEDFIELETARIKAELTKARGEQLQAYDVDYRFYDLANMPEESFTVLLENSKLAHQARIDNARKAEENRLAEIEKEKQRQIEIQKENEKLKAEKEIKDKRNAELRPYIIFIREYDVMVGLEESAYQKELTDIKEAAKQHYESEAREKASNEAKQKAEQDKIQKEQAKIKKQKEETEVKLKAEREENKRLQDELEAKKQAEILAEKQHKAEERKKQNAPDKVKLQVLAKDLQEYKLPTTKNQEVDYIIVNVRGLLNKVVNYINENVEKL